MLIVVLVKKSSSEKIGFDFVMNSEVLNTGKITKIVQQIGHIITKHKAFTVQLTDGPPETSGLEEMLVHPTGSMGGVISAWHHLGGVKLGKYKGKERKDYCTEKMDLGPKSKVNRVNRKQNEHPRGSSVQKWPCAGVGERVGTAKPGEEKVVWRPPSFFQGQEGLQENQRGTIPQELQGQDKE
ncbi:hypothetical protein DUI87_14000 [Hirundo rustica rustica]|uniref:Uncharacterized protein n=1 Tax=Hirundo rustica rustica TaxID=333673 RepID=A0A3M0K753_HIRRU|nr:hypothetical protein DUI87_14000 [Hirundo rustica rustica]